MRRPSSLVRDTRDPRSVAQTEDFERLLSRTPTGPADFRVEKGLDASVIVIIRDNEEVPSRRTTTGYQVFFLPIPSVDAAKRRSWTVDGIEWAGEAAELVGSVGAPGRGGILKFGTTQTWNAGGYYFVVGVNAQGDHSPFQNPFPSPWN